MLPITISTRFKSGHCVNTITNKKKLKALNPGKVEVKLLLFANYFIAYWESPRASLKTTTSKEMSSGWIQKHMWMQGRTETTPLHTEIRSQLIIGRPDLYGENL